MTWPHAHIAVAAAAHGPSAASARHMDSAALPSGPAPRMSPTPKLGIPELTEARERACRLAKTGPNRRYHQGQAQALTTLLLKLTCSEDRA